MFRGNCQSVEENQENNEPIENLRFDRRPALSPTQSVPPPRVATKRKEVEIERKRFGRKEKAKEKNP